MYTSVRPRHHTHTEHGMRFPPQYHISYKWGYYLAPIICRCLLKVLCPVSRPITTLDCVLSKNSNCPCSQIRARDQFPSLSLCTTGTVPQCQMLFLHLVFHLSSYILPRDPQERLRSNKLLNRTTPCELIGDFISSHSCMPRDLI
jgi:hypothetical protein